MKSLLPLILLVSLSCQAENLSLDDMKKYVSIMGAVAMQENCKLMPKEFNNRFSKLIDTIQADLIKQGITQQTLDKLNSDSSQVARIEPFASCDIGVARTIGGQYNVALKWSKKIANKAFNSPSAGTAKSAAP